MQSGNNSILMNREEKIRKMIDNRQEGIMVLEDIHDPHNAMAVVRSCEGFGIQKVYFVFENEAEFDPKRIGMATSSSGNKWLSFKKFKTTAECVAQLKKDGYEIWATVLDKEAKSLTKCKFEKRKMAIWMGNEHRGLSEEAVKAADRKVYIPMKGMVQSLNLSVAAGIILWELTRQREDEGMEKFLIGEGEAEELRKKLRV